MRITLYGFGVGAPPGEMVPATASPATIWMSQTVTRLRTPAPRSASAVAVTWICPIGPTGVTVTIVESPVSGATVTMVSSDEDHATGPSIAAGLPSAST